MGNRLMKDMIKEIEISGNERLIHDRGFLRRMQKTSYLTATEENSQQLNERDSYTTRINRLQRGVIFTITPDPAEEFEIVPDEEIDNEWATIAKLSRERWSKENPY